MNFFYIKLINFPIFKYYKVFILTGQTVCLYPVFSETNKIMVHFYFSHHPMRVFDILVIQVKTWTPIIDFYFEYDGIIYLLPTILAFRSPRKYNCANSSAISSPARLGVRIFRIRTSGSDRILRRLSDRWGLLRLDSWQIRQGAGTGR